VILSVRDLTVCFPGRARRSGADDVHAVRGLSYDLAKGEALGIVGESGSGKSVSSMAVMGLLPASAVVSGSVRLDGTELIGLGDKQLSRLRGSRMSMVFGDPLSALTPVYSVGYQLVEAIRVHNPQVSKDAAAERAVELLDLVGIGHPAERVEAFPHEFSGGMRQRVVIAMAIANNPDLIICDEPTTALDVTIQAQVLEVLKTAQRETGAGLLLITHDLGVIAGIADRVVVMYAGKAVETGGVDDVYYRPRMPYTMGLLGSVPRVDASEKAPLIPIEGSPPSLASLPPGCPFAPRCPLTARVCRRAEPELLLVTTAAARHDSARGAAGSQWSACHFSGRIEEEDLTATDVYPVPQLPDAQRAQLPRGGRQTVLDVDGLVRHYPLMMKGAIFKRRVGTVHAVDGIGFDVKEAETVAIVGESGCGKTTTLLEVLKLAQPQAGRIEVRGKDTAELTPAQRRALRRDIQIVFQDPMASLDPRMPVSAILAEPLTAHGYPKEKISARVRELLRLVGLSQEHASRYPQDLSGGQLERIGIARALALEPKLLVLDEPVSALDVSIQAGVINLLEDLKSRLGLAYLFVTQDLSVVRHIADRVAIMYLGKIVEIGAVDLLFHEPRHPYTKALLSAVPIPDPAAERGRERILLPGDLPSPAAPPSGCRFRTRCPLIVTLSETEAARCATEIPELTVDNSFTAAHRNAAADRKAACHYAERVITL
jgi:glutathione transport system ATP-binding protein